MRECQSFFWILSRIFVFEDIEELVFVDDADVTGIAAEMNGVVKMSN